MPLYMLCQLLGVARPQSPKGKETISEIQKVDCKDPLLGAEGAIELIEKLWPALQHSIAYRVHEGINTVEKVNMRINKPLTKAKIIDDLSEQVKFNRKKSLKLLINE